ncbi:MAG: tetratricopeptide repeat protein, partial [Phycisphaerales bacterium JB050]
MAKSARITSTLGRFIAGACALGGTHGLGMAVSTQAVSNPVACGILVALAGVAGGATVWRGLKADADGKKIDEIAAGLRELARKQHEFAIALTGEDEPGDSEAVNERIRRVASVIAAVFDSGDPGEVADRIREHPELAAAIETHAEAAEAGNEEFRIALSNLLDEAIEQKKFRPEVIEKLNGMDAKLDQVLDGIGAIQDRLPKLHASLEGLRFTLPPIPPAFTGRGAELDDLAGRITTGAMISAVRGMGGIGKTAFAVALAHRLKDGYPDARLYIEMRGTARGSEKPLRSREAMGQVIHAFQPEQRLPETDEEVAAMYRATLHGKRVLLLLDNAGSRSQVKPLLPPEGSLLLVTSRTKFALPGFEPLDLDVLNGADAEALLRKLCARIGDHAGDLAKECGYLAQAITLAGGALAERPSLSVERYIERLKDARLEQLDRYREEGERTIAASIALSEALLEERDPELARRWRMLCVFPGDFDATAVGVVWDAEGDEAVDALVELHRFSVVEWDEETGRYRLHDLVRDYTGAQCEERFDAGLRHAEYFSFVLDTADQWYREPGGERTMDGLALYDRERENIEAGFDWAYSHQDQSEEALALVDRYPGTADILSIRQSTRDQETWLRAALAAAEKARLQERIAQHSGNLGNTLETRGDLDEAEVMYRKSLAIHEELGRKEGMANDYGNLGIILMTRGDLDGAEDMYRKALAINEELGRKEGMANQYGNLGNILMTRGDLDGAEAMIRKALAIEEELGRKEGMANQ